MPFLSPNIPLFFILKGFKNNLNYGNGHVWMYMHRWPRKPEVSGGLELLLGCA